MSILYVGSNTLYQAGAGNIIGATTIVTTTFSDIYGNVLTMANFGAKGFITLEPDTVNQEFVTFTGVTPNSNGTFTLTGIHSVLAVSPYTESSGTVRQHSGGSKVVISDQPAFWNTFGQTANTNTWAAVQTFSALPTIPLTPVASTDAASKGYADGLAIAGGANASSTIKGISKLSIDPASPTAPIAVGDNDTRVPTQNENDALVGTSGTPVSSTNKLVDAADASTTGASGKIVRANGTALPALDGSALTGVTSTQLAASLIAAESLTANKPVSSCIYTPTPIALDFKQTGSLAGGTNTISLTVGNNANRLLVIMGEGDVNLASAFTATADFNGISAVLTVETSSGGSIQGSFIGYVIAPTTGTHNLTITVPATSAGSYGVFSVYNVNQSTPQDGVSTVFGASTSVTTTADGAVGFGFGGAISGTLTYSGNAFTSDISTTSGFQIGDTGLGSNLPQGTAVAATVSGGSEPKAGVITILPATAAVDAVQLASSLTAGSTRLTGFIGFTTGSASAGGAVSVIVAGRVTGLSGLQTGVGYYLNNTNGTFGNAAGSQTRKIGVATTSTSLLITNIW